MNNSKSALKLYHAYTYAKCKRTDRQTNRQTAVGDRNNSAQEMHIIK